MREYLQKHLGNDFIYSSLSAAVALILLVKKPGKGIYVCVDY
jgi:hypothetical protein